MSRRLAASLFLLICSASLGIAQVTLQGARVRVSENVMEGLLTRKISPAYPPLARQAGIQGAVMLQVTIDKNGEVQNIQLISGHPLLAQASIDAVRQWKYRPYLLNGEPVEVETKVQVNFTLADKPPVDGVDGGVSGGVDGGAVAGTPRSGVPQRVRVSSAVASALLLRKVPPVYPQEAKDQHIQGIVVLKVKIDKEGNVANIEALSGPTPLVAPSIEAVRQWKYRPYVLNQTPVEVETQVQVNYTLAD